MATLSVPLLRTALRQHRHAQLETVSRLPAFRPLWTSRLPSPSLAASSSTTVGLSPFARVDKIFSPLFLFKSSSSLFRERFIQAKRTRRAPPHSSSGGNQKPQPKRNNSSAFLSPLITRINRIPETTLVYFIIGLNLVVFLAYQYGIETMKKFKDPRPYHFMFANFSFSEETFLSGRWWTLLTSCISHQEPWHFFINMISLSFMAPPVVALTGPAMFLVLYFGAGVVGAATSLLWHRTMDPLMNKGARGRHALGASCSVYAIMSAFACIQPRTTFLLFFVIPVPAWACVPGIFAWDVYNSVTSPNSKTDGPGHIGGILAGLLFWRFKLRGVSV